MTSLRCLALSALVLALSETPALAAGMKTYLALGDSLAFGETDFTQNPSDGDRGYVKLYADVLAKRNGGVRPKVINLGVDGETTASYSTGGQPLTTQNRNYPNGTTSQKSLFHSTVETERAAGNTISDVTLSLGSNDLRALLATPGFTTLPASTQQGMLLQALATIQANYTSVVTDVKSQLPNANLALVGTYNPYPAVPNDPATPLASPAIQALNAIIAGEAAAVGGRYVDVATPMVGQEAQDTLILTGNPHPNDLGYALIATQLEAQAVPEPGTFLILGCGLIGLLGRGWRRARAA